MEYSYENKAESPDLDLIKDDVVNSDMVDKSVEGGRWDEETGILVVIFTNELSVEDKIKLDTIIGNNSLKKLKRKRISEIDKRTQELILEGFDFNTFDATPVTLHFDLEKIDQINYMGMAIGSAVLSYPFTIPNADYTAYLVFPNAAGIIAFYMTGVVAVKARRQSGWELKNQIQGAITVEAVEAIVDSR